MLLPEVDSVLKDNGYKFCSFIGSGGFSECCDVYSKQYARHFACKIVSITGKLGQERKVCYEKEFNALIRCMHPNIIKVFKSFSTNTHLFLILELCTNGDLSKQIKNHGPIKDEHVLFELLLSIIDALVYLEELHISHKDIKPSNILLDKYKHPILADFGLSAMVEKDTLCDEYSGSVAYIAPEVLKREPYDSLKADMWSLGVTLYFIVTGECPFPTGDEKSLKTAINRGIINIPLNLSPTVKTLIKRSVCVNPEERMTFSEMKSIIVNQLTELKKKSIPKQLRVLRSGGSAISSSISAFSIQRRLSHPCISNKTKIQIQNNLCGTN